MSTAGVDHRSYSFGEFTLEVERGVLLKAGTEVRLRPKSFDVLRYLVERPGRLVSKDELLSAVWGQTVVTEGSLTQCLIDIRRALGDQSQQMIRTLPRRGYLFEVPVTEHADRAERARRWPHWRFAAISAVALAVAAAWWVIAIQRSDAPGPQAAASGPPFIAVLPFVDLSAEQDQGYLADGLAEEILNRLAQAKDLRVIARTSAFSFKGQNADIAAIAARLHVTHVLEGSVRKSGNELRITAQLVETASSSHLWSETYDRTLDDLFKVQDEIAASVAEALQVRLEDQSSGGAARHNAQAHDRFLQGQFFYYRRAPGDIERARDYYLQAVAIDPEYARAWAALSGAYSVLVLNGELSPEVGQAKQREAAEKAVALDPQLPEAHVRLAHYYFQTGDRTRVREHYNRARALGPDNLLVLSSAAGYAARRGHLTEAIELQRRAVELDPLAGSQRATLALYLMAVGLLEEAKTELQQAWDINPALAEFDLGFILILEQRYDEALARIEQWPDGEARDFGLALVHHALGRGAEADAALERLQARSEIVSAIRLAEAYAHRGEIDEAFRWLDIASERIRRDQAATYWPKQSRQIEIRLSPFLSPLHDDPRWQHLLADLDSELE